MHDDDKHDDRDPLDGPRDGDDIDAAFAALVEGLDLSADEGVGPADRAAAPGDAPHNSYSAPEPAGTAPKAPKAIKIAVVLTPLASASALAALCAMSDLDCTIVPARSGAIAVKEFVSAHAEWDVAELLGGVETEPAEAAELAKALSRLSRGGVVLMTADLATDVGRLRRRGGQLGPAAVRRRPGRRGHPAGHRQGRRRRRRPARRRGHPRPGHALVRAGPARPARREGLSPARAGALTRRPGRRRG